MPLSRVGYACLPLGSPGLRSPRTTVLRRATPERLRELIAWNLENLADTLRYNVRQGFGLFRIGTQFIPFGSHSANTLAWWEEFATELRRVGDEARAHGLRLSFHTTAFVVLNSLQETVVTAGLAEIEYQARVLAAMELDTSHRVVVHAGITRPTLAEARDRFCRALDRLSPAARRRVVVENDETNWSVAEVVELARAAGIPVVFDAFHHRVCGGAWRDRPWEAILADVFATWPAEAGPPKVHFSSQDPAKRPGAHGEYVDAGELEEFLTAAARLQQPSDVMFEAKAKDLAVLRLAPVLQRHGVRVGADALAPTPRLTPARSPGG